jgi:hypothetical protein
MLAAGADGPARRELEDAAGLCANNAAQAARDLVAELRGMSGVSAALGLWTAATVAVHPQWVRDLPPAAVETLAADPAESQRRHGRHPVAAPVHRRGGPPIAGTVGRARGGVPRPHDHDA